MSFWRKFIPLSESDCDRCHVTHSVADAHGIIGKTSSLEKLKLPYFIDEIEKLLPETLIT